MFGKNWKTTLLGLLLLIAQAFVDSQKGAKSESLVGYVAGAAAIAAADSKKEEK